MLHTGAEGGVVELAPLAVIEILSPNDNSAKTLERFREYASIGVHHLIGSREVDRALVPKYVSH